MTPEEIIKNKVSHPEWVDLKLTDPTLYKKMSGEEIDRKFAQMLPFFEKWQFKRYIFSTYEGSLLSIEDCLRTIDFDRYDVSLQEKKELTKLFYANCIGLGVSSIINTADLFDIDTQYRIKNLICRSFKTYFNDREKVIKKIISIFELEKKDVEKNPLFAYLPFQNDMIGLDWLGRRINPSLVELLDDWIVLLCFNAKLFSSESFISKLSSLLGEDKADRLLKKLLIFIARQEKKEEIFIYINRKYGRKIREYKKLLIAGQIVEDIKFGELKFKTNQIQFYKCIMPVKPYLSLDDVEYIKQNVEINRDLVIYIKEDIITGRFCFRPVFKQDMEYLMGLIKVSRYMSITISHGTKDKSGKENKEINKSQKENKVPNPNSTVILKKEVSNKEARILASDIYASNLKFSKGSIEYVHTDGKSYFLKSVRIDREVPPEILSLITSHKFTLTKDRSVNNGKKRRFLFEPANDLSFLLAEIKRIQDKEIWTTDGQFPKTGEFELPWSNVRFYDGIMILFHPNPSKRGTFTPFHFRHPDILHSFEDIRPYIETRCSKLRVKTADGVIISLQNFKDFAVGISQYKDWETEEHVYFGDSIKKGIGSFISKESFSKNRHIIKSPYLSYLAAAQHSNYKIAYLLERVIHESGLADNEEYGYLFVLKEGYDYLVLLYENITDSSRSSILFKVYKHEYQKAVDIIRRFWAGDIKNKRQKLSWGKIRFNDKYIQDIKRIKHSSKYEWIEYLEKALYHSIW